MSALFAAGLSGCTNDGLEDNTVKNPVQTGDEIIFGSRLSGDAETRTVYGDRTNSGVPVYWEADGSDQIAIYCLQSAAPANHLVHYKVTPVMNGEDPTATAESVVKVNAAEAGLQWGDRNTLHNFYAFYPASAVKGTAEENATGMITANIPVTQQVQEWREGTMETTDPAFKGKKTYFGLPNMDYAYMYAYTQVDPSNIDEKTPVNLAFKNLVTVLDITLQGPASGTATITNINVSAVDGTQPILTGDFTCNIRAAKAKSSEVTATCTPVGSFSEERNTISIPCYDKKEGRFIQLGAGELLNVKAYIIPQDVNNTVTKRTLQITVSMLNGAPCKKTLSSADVTPHKINRVILPKLQIGGTNYWMSSLDPDIYVSELSIPGSKFSVLTKENTTELRNPYVYQNATIEQQFTDGVRAFILQTAVKGENSKGSWRPENNTFTYDVHVVAEDQDHPVMTLEAAIQNIASYLKACEEAGKPNEFAFVMLTYTTGDRYYGTGHYGGFLGLEWTWDENATNAEQTWIQRLRDKVNELAGNTGNRIYTGEITPNTTIDDVKGKIILKANYNSQDMISGYTGSAPIMFTYWGSAYGPEGYQDANGGMPMDWGAPVWYENSPGKLRWYYQEVTTVGNDQEATTAAKRKYITKLFEESVDAYKNDTSHKTWFMNDLGGRYTDPKDINGRNNGIVALTEDMNQMGVDALQNRTENAGLGLIYMNFADKQSGSGTLYKSDWLIQTVIDNNFKFALRKAGGTSGTTAANYDAGYSNGGNAIGWDK